MIEIKCSLWEKGRILKALHNSGICPFAERCSDMLNGDFNSDHDRCREYNIKWIITDAQDESETKSMPDMNKKRSFSLYDVAKAGSLAATEMVGENPTMMLITDEMSRLTAKTMFYLFNKKED